jgi:LAO/AO transport system kinase
MKLFFVYILRCSDRTYYCGHTDDMDARMLQHAEGRIGYTSTRKPVELAWQGEFETRDGALAFEQRIKGWSRAKKEMLMAGDWKAVQRHAWGTRNPLPVHLLEEASIPQPERRGGASIPQPERGLGLEQAAATLADGRAPLLAVRPEVSKATSTQARPILEGSRRALAKAITLLESTRPDHRGQADALLQALMPHTGRAMRIGISGVPGVGKSTFIETLGLHLIEQGHRIAVLAIDPSSSLSGGSILGDKTRMERLSVHERAFIRPSPASGTLGGVAERTRETMLLCEAAGYDVVIVETVGVGQSETAVAGMTDLFVLMQLPNAGDDLQAIKRGVMELADLVVINKADLDHAAATRAQAQIASALRIFGDHGSPLQRETPTVMQLSALAGHGVAALWQQVRAAVDARRGDGRFDARRREQALTWMWDVIRSRLFADFREHAAVCAALDATTTEVAGGTLAPPVAARRLLQAFERT